MPTTPGEFYAALPPICKAWGTTLLLMSALTTMRLLNPMLLILNLELVFSKFQIWRLLTCYLWPGNFGFPLVFDMLMIIQCGTKLEKDVYEGRPADFLFILIFGMIVMLPCTLIPFFALPILSKSMVTMIVYVWSRKYPNQEVSVMGLFAVPAFYFPWLLVGMTLVMGGNVFVDLLGCLVGHLFYFLDEVFPQTAGRALLVTPQWVHWIIYQWAQSAPDMFPESARIHPSVQAVYARAQAPAPRAPPPSQGNVPGGSSGPSRAPAPEPRPVPPQQTSQAFRGRSYRLDRD